MLKEKIPTRRKRLESLARKRVLKSTGRGDRFERSRESRKRVLSSKDEIKPINIMKNPIKKHF